MVLSLAVYALGGSEKYLRYMRFLESHQTVTLKLGEQTETDDYTSAVIGHKPYDHVSTSMIEEFCKSCVGVLTQDAPKFVPRLNPVIDYSLKESREVEDPSVFRRANMVYMENRIPKQFEVRDMKVVSHEPPYVTIQLLASPQFHPRTFAVDFGRHFNTVAHVTDYQRTTVGPFAVKDCIQKHETYVKDIKSAMERCTYPYIKAVTPYLDRLKLYKERRLYNTS